MILFLLCILTSAPSRNSTFLFSIRVSMKWKAEDSMAKSLGFLYMFFWTYWCQWRSEGCLWKQGSVTRAWSEIQNNWWALWFPLSAAYSMVHCTLIGIKKIWIFGNYVFCHLTFPVTHAYCIYWFILPFIFKSSNHNSGSTQSKQVWVLQCPHIIKNRYM